MAGLPLDAFGVSGSILLGLHNPAFSDIDLLVYGADNARRLRAVIDDLAREGLTPLPEERRAQWRADTAARFGLEAETVADLEARRWHYRLFRGRYVSLHSTRADHEIREAYGDRRWHLARPGGRGGARRSTPARPCSCRPCTGSPTCGGSRVSPGSLDEVVAFEGLYCNAAERGERILVTGHLEAERAGGRRLVVGSGFLPDGGALRVVR